LRWGKVFTIKTPEKMRKVPTKKGRVSFSERKMMARMAVVATERYVLKLATTGEACLMVHWFKKMGAMVAKTMRIKKRIKNKEKLLAVSGCFRADWLIISNKVGRREIKGMERKEKKERVRGEYL
jgi:hypothetical protein